MAGYGLKSFLIAQSLNQIEKAYGANNAILDNCHVSVAFATNDERTAKRVSDARGTATEMRAMTIGAHCCRSPQTLNWRLADHPTKILTMPASGVSQTFPSMRRLRRNLRNRPIRSRAWWTKPTMNPFRREFSVSGCGPSRGRLRSTLAMILGGDAP